MSYELVAEVLRYTPPGLTAAEKLTLVIIAEAAQNHDRIDSHGRKWQARTCGLSIETIALRVGTKPESMRRIFQRLAARGLEVRIPIGYDKAGSPVYAARGRATEYRLPPILSNISDLPTTTTAHSRDDSTAIHNQRRDDDTAISEQRRDADPGKAGPWSQKGGTLVPPPTRTNHKEPPPYPPSAYRADCRTREGGEYFQ